MNLGALADRPPISRLPQRVLHDVEGERMNFSHDASMGTAPEERQQKILLPYSNGPL